ncbi:ras-related protein Rap-2a-like [Crassostrea angulata]|uniref:ras-related protein Rap-2a-like n=1 Tax=Magallana angulata TaxID=2784310 RepID=UPI0022B1011A|nr:ras-related protein Rap-2a-like [Crassostrea angulata]
MKVLKVVILGAEKVGKSLLLDQFLKADDPVQKRSDCSSSKDVYNVNGKTIRFPDGIHRRVDFVDTSDLDEFPAMKRVYIETGNAFVIVYAIDDKRSYEFAKSLCDEIYSIKGNLFTNIVLVGNKIDTGSKRRVSTAEALADSNRTKLFSETSAKLCVNIGCPFIILFNNYLQNFKHNRTDIQTRRKTHSKSVSSPVEDERDEPFRIRLNTI